MNLIPIEELTEVWVRVHKKALAEASRPPSRSDLSWWREACANLRPTPEDDQILEDEEEKH